MHTLSETQTRGDREKDRHRERGSEREQHTDKASSRRGPVAHPELEKQTEGSLRHTDVTLPVDWQMHVAQLDTQTQLRSLTLSIQHSRHHKKMLTMSTKTSDRLVLTSETARLTSASHHDGPAKLKSDTCRLEGSRNRGTNPSLVTWLPCLANPAVPGISHGRAQRRPLQACPGGPWAVAGAGGPYRAPPGWPGKVTGSLD